MAEIFLRVFSDEHFLGAFFQTVILIVLGYICRRKNYVDNSSKKTIQFLVWKLSVPCVAFNAFMQNFSIQAFKAGVAEFTIAAVSYILLFAAGKIIFLKKGKDISTISGLFTAVGQVTLFSMPVLLSVYQGNDSMVALHISMISIDFRIMVYIVGFFAISGEKIHLKSLGSSLKKIFANPIMIGMFSGIAVWLLQNQLPFLRLDKSLPSVYTTVTSLTKLLNPLSMFLIGMTIGEADFASAFKDVKAWLTAFMRNFIAPVIVLLFAVILNNCGIMKFDEYSLISLVIGFSAPVSVSLSIFCVQFNKEQMFASRACMISTLMTLISLPLNFVFTYYALSIIL